MRLKNWNNLEDWQIQMIAEQAEKEDARIRFDLSKDDLLEGYKEETKILKDLISEIKELSKYHYSTTLLGTYGSKLRDEILKEIGRLEDQ